METAQNGIGGYSTTELPPASWELPVAAPAEPPGPPQFALPPEADVVDTSHSVAFAPMDLPAMQPMPIGMGAEPEMPSEGHMLGVSLFLVGVGGVVGLRYGGALGALSGALFGGAGINAFRAARNVARGTKDGDREAIVSGTYAVLGAGVAGYLAWRAATGGKR